MGPLDQARQHLDKAKEFLDAAELDFSAGHLNAATSNAVTSGVNSKDAMCLALTGRTTKSDDHRSAVKELEQAGAAGDAVAPTLGRLLALKTPAQYQAWLPRRRQDGRVGVLSGACPHLCDSPVRMMWVPTPPS